MSRGRVIIVSSDEWIAKLIGAALLEQGADVLTLGSAAEALRVLDSGRQEAVVCDAVLPDHDGAWLAGRMREGASVTTPFLLLAHADDSFSRLDALRAGADACFTKPFRVDELCLQIQALISAVRRASEHGLPASSLASQAAPPLSRPPEGHALEGDLAQLNLSTVLTLLEMERRSGVMVVQGARQTASVVMHSGTAVMATLGGTKVPPLTVLRRLLRWKTGRFTFRSGESMGPPPSDQASIGALLIEAARLDDESPNSLFPSVAPPPLAPAAPARSPAASLRGAAARVGPGRGRPPSPTAAPPPMGPAPSRAPAASGLAAAPAPDPAPPPGPTVTDAQPRPPLKSIDVEFDDHEAPTYRGGSNPGSRLPPPRRGAETVRPAGDGSAEEASLRPTGAPPLGPSPPGSAGAPRPVPRPLPRLPPRPPRSLPPKR